MRLVLALAALMLGAGHAFAQSSPQDTYSWAEQPAAEPMEEVIVTGEWPGPRMWKISKGDHVLWLLGTLDPLPKKLSWQSHEVEAVLKDAQEVLSDEPAISANASLFGKLRLYMQWRSLRKNNDGEVLHDIVPTDLYTRFADLKTKYAANDDGIERLRPALAGGRLYTKAVNASGLSARGVVSKAVLKLAKKHDVKIQRGELKIDDVGGILKELSETPRDVEIKCLEATVTRLERDIGVMTARANAWAVGDVDALRRLAYTDNASSCWDALASSPRVKAVIAQAQDTWMAAAEAALATNRTTLAMRSINDILGRDSLLMKFLAKGYAVEAP